MSVVRSLVRRAIQSMRSTFNLQVTFHLKGMYSLYIQFTEYPGIGKVVLLELLNAVT